MRRRPVLAAVAVAFAVAIPATLAAGPITGADRTNASRACSALRASTGAKTFAQMFGTSRANAFGKCVATFAHTASQARVAAKTTCSGNPARQRCVNAAVTAALNQQVTAMKNAAKTCAALRTSMGAAAFAKRFGTNGNARNAFGKCVSSQASQGAQNRTQVFRAQLAPLNGSGVSGTALLRLKGTTLTVQLSVKGLEANQSHLAHIHGLTTGDATCPTASADTNGDKLISFQEGLPFYGPVLVELASQQVGANGRLDVTKTITENVQSLLPLDTRTIVVHGLTVNGAYVATLPVACGAITG